MNPFYSLCHPKGKMLSSFLMYSKCHGGVGQGPIPQTYASPSPR